MLDDKRIQLVIVDPQHDFTSPQGALAVPGAEDDCRRLAALIERRGAALDAVCVTMDSHHELDVAHPIYWVDEQGQHPEPFTIISPEDMEAGRWKTANPDFQEGTRKYVRQLAENGRYPLCIWPPHCVIGSWGHAMDESVSDAVRLWEKESGTFVDYLKKGMNPFTEHYSLVKADVPDHTDPTTMTNTSFLQTLDDADQVWISGQAKSHCVACSIRDIAEERGDAILQKIVFLEDTSSNVPGFEKEGDSFMSDMSGRGMRIAQSVDV